MGSKKKNKNKNGDKPKTESDTAVNNGDGGNTITDSRFAAVHWDPRFQRVPKHKAKVTIDSRFDSLFSDKRFSSSAAPIDKRGKPKKQNSQNSLRHYYRMDEDKERKEETKEEEEQEEEEEEESGSEELEPSTDVAKRAELSSDSGELESEECESESEDEAVSAESESTTDTDEEDVGDADEEEEAEQLEESIPCIEKETRRLAVVNMDWSHVKAVDLYVLLSSFLPKEGQILSVAVYPSEFGLQRMKEEEIHGPVGLFDDEVDKDDENDEDEIDDEKLRAYERSRLRYYFAVVECDSTATADYLYNACDGAEFERSSNVLDLRFIPDSMEFKDPPRDVATKAPEKYDGLDFQTRALQLSKMDLTWDEDEPDRVKTLKRKLNADQLADLELKEFLASDESGSDEDDENENPTEDQSDKKDKKREKYLALLQGDGDSDGNHEDEDKQDLEITFNSGLEDLSKRILEKKEQKSESVFEANLRKRREKKKMMKKNKSKDSSDDEDYSDSELEGAEEMGDFFIEEPPAKRSRKAGRNKGKKAEKVLQDGEAEATRAELELLVADETGGDNGLRGYNIKRKKDKGKKGKEGLEEVIAKIPTVDYNDPRFSAVFTSPLFALDPTDPQYKRSATHLRQVALNHKKGDRQETVNGESDKPANDADLPSGSLEVNKDEMARSYPQPSRKEKIELSSLVRSLKMKSKQVQLPKKDGKMRLRDEVREKIVEEKHELPSMQSLKTKKKKNKD
ncbi:pre-rRNA-processing protein esf1 [Punica granatum]|uniref:Uncharacterized protein n=2 Tax=Punica granatum TaxID=22663 RepID=A0A218W6W0_PUNGR|nr:pre-rRNA-processing protein esf1 [Punica granatum]OWM68238.1 hypothetical protein CDL15_Pgr004720 [Punica granatum]PKI74415.1 hypothetical protein CRG98_005179 [Punica granatum]